MSQQVGSLSRIFQAAAHVVAANRADLNLSDKSNGNHGDQMVAIFETAQRAAQETSEASLADAMAYAAVLLEDMPDNSTAQVYRRGLLCLAEQFRQRDVGLVDLLAYVHSHLAEGEALPSSQIDPEKSAALLKALVHAMANWEQSEKTGSVGEAAGSARGADMGYLFGVGMAYLQAKQQGGDRLDILAETVVASSPLAGAPDRRQSGKLVVRAMLEAMRSGI